MNHQVRHVMDDCACNAQDDTELTTRHSLRTVTHINMVWCGVVGGGGGGADD